MSSRSSSSSIGQVECECEGLYTSWTNDNPNPGRRFHACQKYKVRISSFCHSIWLERAMAIIPGLLRSKNELEVEGKGIDFGYVKLMMLD
ncbi:hypothetical protein BUALT_Bualt15G0133300 [Buddleja alternifolia]|uniref:Zinc finger GRF-type domain-containing protein n=1 Tax=Buddleja alternifolia TaxID=168488 RepID=A0AAV6WQT1_9LAMI|nr:hypothetical protein BUALT_Bualt15G0133300 [Buddleja alternifolia]